MALLWPRSHRGGAADVLFAGLVGWVVSFLVGDCSVGGVAAFGLLQWPAYGGLLSRGVILRCPGFGAWAAILFSVVLPF